MSTVLDRPVAPSDRLLQLDEVCTTLGISDAMARKLIRLNVLTSVRIGRARRIPLSVIERVLKEGIILESSDG